MLRKRFSSGKPLIFGHRGAAGVAPENTVPSYALALALGADVLEFDVHATSDGEIVVIHDATLERTTDGEGEVRQHTWAQLRQLDAGYQFSRGGGDYPYRGQGIRIPLLAEVLAAFPGVPCNMEIKQGDPPIVEEVLAVIRRAGASDRMLLAAEHDSIMTSIRAAAGDLPTGFATLEVVDFIGRVQANRWDDYQPAGCALQIPPSFNDIALVSADSVAAAHRFGLEIHVWTINQRREADQLLAIGVDGIMSDLPGMARVAVDAG
ncbi:MAG TPA: glycerophosphodiester phosphodiesterase [Terriglobales bacterium]|nr:glycerophosphodiester phosphodiesterase [Terriglobales bacterium]